MTPRLTRAQRKELRRRGPFRLVAGDLRETGGAIVAEFRYAVHEASVLHGAIVAALNAIATEPEPVARAREALMREIMRHNGPGYRSGGSAYEAWATRVLGSADALRGARTTEALCRGERP